MKKFEIQLNGIQCYEDWFAADLDFQFNKIDIHVWKMK